MHVNKNVDYALRAMLELTSHRGESLKAEQLSSLLGVPQGSLENILTDLRRSGLTVAQRGLGGGFRLARDPSQISLADIIRAINGPLVTICGLPPDTVSYSGAAANLRDVWIAVQHALEAVLETVSLADVDRSTLPVDISALVGTDDIISTCRSPLLVSDEPGKGMHRISRLG